MIHFYKHTFPSLLILSCLCILLSGCSPSDEVLSAAQGKYASVNGTGTMDEVFGRIADVIGGLE